MWKLSPAIWVGVRLASGGSSAGISKSTAAALKSAAPSIAAPAAGMIGRRILPSTRAQCRRHRHARRAQRRQESADEAHRERPHDADLSELRRDIELKAEAEGAHRHAVEEDPGERGSEQRAR